MDAKPCSRVHFRSTKFIYRSAIAITTYPTNLASPRVNGSKIAQCAGKEPVASIGHQLCLLLPLMRDLATNLVLARQHQSQPRHTPYISTGRQSSKYNHSIGSPDIQHIHCYHCEERAAAVQGAACRPRGSEGCRPRTSESQSVAICTAGIGV